MDSEVAQAWGASDLRLRLRRNWMEVGAHLGGKINILVGDDDNYYLANPVLRLREFLESRNASANIEILPAHDHAALDAEPVHLRVQRQIDHAYYAGSAQGRDR